MAFQLASINNRLLAALPPVILAGLLFKLQQVPLPLREVLAPADTLIRHVYFPQVGMISLVAVLDDGRRAEVGIVGREGLCGVSLLAGVNTTFTEAVVQLPGMALRMTAADFREEVASDGPFRAILLRIKCGFRSKAATYSDLMAASVPT